MFKVLAQDQYDDPQVGLAPDGATNRERLASPAIVVVPDISETSKNPNVTLSGFRRFRAQAGASWRKACDAIEDFSTRVDLAPDLAQDIGSRKWLRGLGTMLGLGAVALVFWPDISAVEAATGIVQGDEARDEYRSRLIMPLGLGGDTGRRMAANKRVLPLAVTPERPRIQLVATLASGDGLGRMLSRAGVGDTDIARINDLVARNMQGDGIASGTRFDITLGRRPAPDAARPLDDLSFRARFDLDLNIERMDGVLTLTRHPILVDETPLRIRGTIGSSFYRSARNSGAPIAAIQEWLRAVDEQVSLEDDISAGDEFDMIVSYKRSARGERQVGQLLYAGIERNGKARLQLLRWGKEGHFYSASGFGQTRNTSAGAPVSGYITSRYGMRRHPILGYARMHSGIDYGARYGSPIYAVADGAVTFAGRHGGHGNYVRLSHGGGLGTGYGHMSRIAVNSGARVRAGQVIGYVGSTGLSTGPHLHFEAYRGGRTVNPAGLSFTSRPQVDKNELASFRHRLNSLLEVQPGAALENLEVPAHPQEEAGREIDRVTTANPAARPMFSDMAPSALAAIGRGMTLN